MISKLYVTIFPDNNDIVLLIIFPVNNFESWMSRFGFPLWFLRLIVSYGTFLCTNHDSTINPAKCTSHSNYFSVIKSDINLFKSFHRHIIESYYKFLAIGRISTFHFKDIIGQVVYILLLPSMCETRNITATNHINIVVRKI